MVDDISPIARSPIHPVDGAVVVDGWERCGGAPRAALQLCDLSFLAKVHVRGSQPDEVGTRLGTSLGNACWDSPDGPLVIASGPDEWLLLAPQGQAAALAEELERRLSGVGGLLSVVDLTHGRALMRLTGEDAVRGVLSKVCAVNFSDHAVPNGSALRSSVASVVTDIIRDDTRDGRRSYLLHCERSAGQYLFDSLLDAGADHGIEACGPTAVFW